MKRLHVVRYKHHIPAFQAVATGSHPLGRSPSLRLCEHDPITLLESDLSEERPEAVAPISGGLPSQSGKTSDPNGARSGRVWGVD